MTSPQTFSLDRGQITLGRDPSCDIRLKGIGVSRFHAKLFMDNRGAFIEDLDTASGILVNGEPAHKHVLKSGDILTVGVYKFSISFDHFTISLLKIDEPEKNEAREEPLQQDLISIGRDPSNTIRLNHPMVSRFHATVKKNKDFRYILEDHGSTNGTFVNGKPVRTAKLADGDIILVGPHRLYLDNGIFQHAQDFNHIKLEAFNVSVVKNGCTLLDDVSLSISPGEFIVIMGPSGAGKSTLALALMGQIPLRNGSVYYNGLPMRSFVNAFRSAIGFVTQENLLRIELTVGETFHEQSILRLPKDSIAAEHGERIREVMELLDLTGLSRRRIADLSGGEAKRVHFGIELLSSPTVVFLDEPFAGLDPGLIHKFMSLFRQVCDKGHTLLLTTHTLEQIDLCNRILFMNGGRLLFSGTATEIKSNYGVDSLAQVFERERSTVRQAPFVRGPGTKSKSDWSARANEPAFGLLTAQPLYKPRGIAMPRQCMLLIGRYFKITLRDKRNLIIMLLQAPIIAIVLACTFKPDAGYFSISFYFCLSISAIWMGGMNSVREIAREWPVIDREFRIGLSSIAYIASKIVVFSIMGGLQALVFGGCIKLLFEDFTFTHAIVFLLATACISGTILGLCISAVSKNVNIAISWLPIIFIPQIFFSGILVPFDEMSDAGQVLSHLTVARPIFSMFKKICFLDQPLSMLTEWRALFFLCAGLIILMIASIRFRRTFSR
ncbi:MAG: FHA domain-containing protein [Chitinivibrionales bacterium]